MNTRGVSINLRPAMPSDSDSVWNIFHAVIAAGDAFAFDPQMPRAEALAYWFQKDAHTYVAEQDGQIVGAYLIKPNQPGRGSHIANGAYMVSPTARGLGVGRRLGEHSLREAKKLGFRAMQFNIVVATNTAAVHLWEQLGFRILATLPGVFRHAQLGFVDAYVMFRELDDVDYSD